jgi:hypothetical protein
MSNPAIRHGLVGRNLRSRGLALNGVGQRLRALTNPQRRMSEGSHAAR